MNKNNYESWNHQTVLNEKETLTIDGSIQYIDNRRTTNRKNCDYHSHSQYWKYFTKELLKLSMKLNNSKRETGHTFNVIFHLICFILYFQYSWLTRTYWKEKMTNARRASFSTPVSTSCMVKSSTARFRSEHKTEENWCNITQNITEACQVNNSI